MDMQEFLSRLKNKKITSIEVRNFIEQITNNYELAKLRLVHYEMESFYYHTPFTLKEAEVFSNYIIFLEKKIKQVENNSFFKKLNNEPRYDTFIEEMQSLKVNIAYKVQRDRFRKDGIKRCFLDLSHYNQDDRVYRNLLIKVQQIALTEVSKLSDEQIKRQLIRLKNIRNSLKKSMYFYIESSKDFVKGNLDESEFKYRLANQFIFEAPESYEHAKITNEFMFHLHDAIAYKKGCISSFIEELSKVISSDDSMPDISQYPNPVSIAEQYHKVKGSKHKQYSSKDIEPVMEVTKTYIEENPGIHTIHGHIKKIIDKCNGLKGGRDAKSNWIKFYAEKAGLETK